MPPEPNVPLTWSVTRSVTFAVSASAWACVIVPALRAVAISSLPSATSASITVCTVTECAFATSAMDLPAWSSVVSADSVMPIALATTDASETASLRPPHAW